MEYKISSPRRVSTPAQMSLGGFVVERRGRFWAVLDAAQCLVCLTVYRRGALEVVRRLGSGDSPSLPVALP